MSGTDFARYADDQTPYVSNYSLDDVIKSLGDESLNLFKWFLCNPIEINNNKYHLMINIKSCMNLKIANINAGNGTCENLLVVKVGLSPSKINYFICFNESPSKITKNVFYSTFKAVFVLKIIKFLLPNI